jgi:hypothetical protein
MNRARRVRTGLLNVEEMAVSILEHEMNRARPLVKRRTGLLRQVSILEHEMNRARRCTTRPASEA